METILISDEGELDLVTAKRLADREADARLGPSTCLAWFDATTGRESPAHASECDGDCELPGWMEYAATRGASLRVDVLPGPFSFCYRSVAEFL